MSVVSEAIARIEAAAQKAVPHDFRSELHKVLQELHDELETLKAKLGIASSPAPQPPPPADEGPKVVEP